jgi:hypothetical protein
MAEDSRHEAFVPSGTGMDAINFANATLIFVLPKGMQNTDS